MHKSHKIKLNPTSQQEQYLLQACGVARFAFNWGLAEWKKQYEEGEKPSEFSLRKQFDSIKNDQFPWVYDVTSRAVNTGFRNLGRAFKSFFRRCKSKDKKKGYPRFKSKKHSKKSFCLEGKKIKTDGHQLKIEKLPSWINMTESLRLKGKIVSATISHSPTGWFISITVDIPKPTHYHKKKIIGIDLGVSSLVTLSNGQRFENQKLLPNRLGKLRRLNKELSRRTEGSKRWRRTKYKLAKLHYKIANKRLNFLHKMTTSISFTYHTIGVEDLDVTSMLSNRGLSLYLSDVAFGEILRQLSYKVEWYGGSLVQVDRYFPSSQLCSNCGVRSKKMELSDRTFECSSCGFREDRDLNASLNIEREAGKEISRRSGFLETLNGHGQNVRLPLEANLDEVSSQCVH